MPGWNIHLEVGRRINRKLKYAGRRKEEFLLGCLLPDINNGYINEVKIKRGHGETHWAFDKKSSLNFFAKYRQEILAREPIYMGHLVHLYTDGFFNYDFYRNFKKSEKWAGVDEERKLKIKHNDFWIYDAKFTEQDFNISKKKEVAEIANRISKIEIDEEDIAEIEEILAKGHLAEKMRGGKYIFYKEEELDNLMERMIESFINDYLKEENA